MPSVLKVDGLDVDYRRNGRWLSAVSNVSFELERGEVLGIVGESGCGKSTLARAMARLLPRNGRISSGRVELDGSDLVSMDPARLAAVRWKHLAVVFQGALNVLDPVYNIGFQIAEGIRAHQPEVSRSEAVDRARSLLESVGIPGDRVRSYPHELSGGMRQRVCIAMAMALSPDVVIADEPTTALDVISQDNVLERLLELQRKEGTSLIIISHDMGVIAETCDRVAVMYAGSLVEVGPVRELFRSPSHPYTMGLQNAIPRFDQELSVVSIPGFPPSTFDDESGCRFLPRCPFAIPVCEEYPPFVNVGPRHEAACYRAREGDSLRAAAADPATWVADQPLPMGSTTVQER